MFFDIRKNVENSEFSLEVGFTSNLNEDLGYKVSLSRWERFLLYSFEIFNKKYVAQLLYKQHRFLYVIYGNAFNIKKILYKKLTLKLKITNFI